MTGLARHAIGTGRLPTVYRGAHGMLMDETELGKRIVKAYDDAGLNRHQFAKALGTTYPNVLRWETGETKPKGAYLAKIASTCRCRLEWLMTGEGAQYEVGTVPVDDEARGIIDQVIVDLQQDEETAARVRMELTAIPWRGATRDTIWQYANDTLRRLVREDRGKPQAANHGGPAPTKVQPRAGSMTRNRRKS